MLKLNRAVLRDKIYACWIGKNIGGTMGTPFEGNTEIQSIEGFTTPEGTVLPNDDLDLQLIWLKALEEKGPYGITAQVLGEYWLNYISPSWNEYGIGKGNLRLGLLPPLSGEYENRWKHSNGAWIRSEIWACVTPGCPDAAIRYAVEDAMVDHGMSEGTFAEMFTAAVESAAFVVSDLFELIRIGLSKIPQDCRVAKSIRTAIDCYERKLDWKEARQAIVEENKDLGWFQAPGNIAFTVIGLLYGEGNFKKSMTIAINCGDDTDCTGATCGALLGIMGGTSAIPADWRRYIGDAIVTVAINRGDCGSLPGTCSQLTDRVIALTPQVLYANRCFDVQLTDGEQDLSDLDTEKLCGVKAAEKLFSRPGLSYEVNFIHASAAVFFDADPVLAPFGECTFRIRFKNLMPDPRSLTFKWHLPEGFSISGPGSCPLRCGQAPAVCTFTVKAGGQVEPLTRLILEAVSPGRPTAGLIPVTILGS